MLQLLKQRILFFWAFVITLSLIAQVTNSFIYKQLLQLKTSKATGLDGIPSRLLKDSAVTISLFLTHIVNLSITSQRILPHDWKHAQVIPLYKEGARDEIDNYRPISILPVVSKILERAVQQQLVDYLESHGLFSRYQCGFRHRYSTQSTITFLCDSIRRNMDAGQLTGAIFIDFRIRHLTPLITRFCLTNCNCLEFMTVNIVGWPITLQIVPNQFWLEGSCLARNKWFLEFRKVLFWALYCFPCMLRICRIVCELPMY